jgi:heat shock protein HslJ
VLTSGTYKTSGSDGLTITPGISTLAICGEGSLDLVFVHSLAKAKSYAIANEQLTITLTDEGTLAFEVGTPAGSPGASAKASTAASAAASRAASAAPTVKPTAKPTTKPSSAPSSAPGASTAPAPVTGLTGKVWQLTAITEKVPAFQGVVPDAQQASYTLEFKADGTFAAKADCNTVAGTFVTADPSAASGDLAIKPGVSTTAACPDGSFADLYVIGLTNASTYAVVNSQLTITLEDQGTLTFK